MAKRTYNIRFRFGVSVLDKLICWITDGPFSHVEIEDTVTDVTLATEAWSGVHYIRRKYLIGRWATIPIELNEDQVVAARAMCVGDRYDYLGVLRFVLRFLKTSPGRWFCSENVAQIIQNCGGPHLMTDYLISPNKLYRMLR